MVLTTTFMPFIKVKVFGLKTVAFTRDGRLAKYSESARNLVNVRQSMDIPIIAKMFAREMGSLAF